MLSNLPLFFLLLLAGTFIFSLVINSILLKFSRTLGIRNNPEIQIRWSPSVKPALGGITFYLVFLIAFLMSAFIIKHPESSFSNIKSISLICALTLAFIIGLADDAFDTKPLLKFSGQVICALILLLGGIKINCFQSEFINHALTVLWIVAIMNSFNMLDNMDAIATIAALSCFIFFVVADYLQTGNITASSIISFSILGALCAFLHFNWNPSKMFMGDTGSQFLGALLGVNGILYCWNLKPFAENSIAAFPLVNCTLIALVFILPLADTSTVFINRILKGNSPFIGGKDHTTHHLFFMGLSEKAVAFIFLLIGLISAAISITLIRYSNGFSNNCFIFLLFPITVFASLFIFTRLKKRDK
jgi:UDP-GlcNAc:undecaprenyl-phosphate/decaprenyl-phosphate GlcNAc-1-phosphate transferase